MKSEEERPIDKVRYEKPTAIDLGPAAPVVGASCMEGHVLANDICGDVGNGAVLDCSTGNTAGRGCSPTGNSPGLRL